MVLKPERGRYITLEDVRVSYKAKDDTIHLTSSDPDIPNSSFYMTLNKGTATEEALREVLIENGLIREDQPAAAIEPAAASISSLKDAAPEIIVDILTGNPRTVFISGAPGTGKGFTMSHLAHVASRAQIPVLIVRKPHHDETKEANINTDKVRTVRISELPAGAFNPFNPAAPDNNAWKAICALLGGSQQVSGPVEEAVLKSITIASRNRLPSLNQVVELLLASPDPYGESTGQRLDSIRKNLPNEDLLFGVLGSQEDWFAPGTTTTIILDGIDLPEEGLPSDMYTVANSFAVAIQSMVLTRILKETTQQLSGKLLVVDNHIPDEDIRMLLSFRRSTQLSMLLLSHDRVPVLTESEDEFLFGSHVKEFALPEQADLSLGEFVWKHQTGDLEKVQALKPSPELFDFRNQLSL